jgi:hypothetical protein
LTAGPGWARLFAMDSASVAIISAVVALLVGIISGLFSVLVSRGQVKAQVDQYTQTQFGGILAKRIEVYPALWQILMTSLSDRRRKGLAVDRGWAEQLLHGLIEWHARNGIFLTQRSYAKFVELRNGALEINERPRDGEQPTNDDLVHLDKLWGGDSDTGEPGLATELKNDLGSYRSAAISR